MLQLVTIDQAHSRDLDDAIEVTPLADGFLVTVAVADPTPLVLPGSDEDVLARDAVLTLYARDRVLRSLLPMAVTQGQASLIEGEDRKAIVFRIELGPAGEVRSFTPESTSVKVARRLSYEGVAERLSSPADSLDETLGAAWAATKLLSQRRRSSGGVAFVDALRGLWTDEDGRLRQVDPGGSISGYLIVQEAMILANRCAAAWMVAQDIPVILRNHVARLSAPAAADFAHSLEAWAQSGVLASDDAQQAFNTVLGKADYGCRALGHYGLGEPLYTHVTSPLRRYADLVNLRQMRARLAGTPLPYRLAELEGLCAEMNSRLEQLKEERSQGYKQALNRKVERAASQGRVAHLADHELVAAVRLALASAEFSGALADELVSRLCKGVAGDKLVDALCLDPQRSKLPDEVRRAALVWIRSLPGRSRQILLHAEQAGLAKPAQVASVEAGLQGGQPSFRAHAEVEFLGGLAECGRLQASGEGARKKEAQQLALLGIVAALLGLQVDAIGDASRAQMQQGENLAGTGGGTGGRGADGDAQGGVAEGARGADAACAQPAALGVNFKGALLELCQARRLASPTFTCATDGPSHRPTFIVTVELRAGARSVGVDGACGSVLYAVSDPLATKKDAQSQACERLLALLGRDAPLDHSGGSQRGDQEVDLNGGRAVGRTSPAATMYESNPGTAAGTPVQTPPEVNAVGELQELTQRRRWPLPAYEVVSISSQPPVFKATVRIGGGGAGKSGAVRMKTFQAEAGNKQGAKQSAAAAALAALSHGGAPGGALDGDIPHG